MPQITQLDNDPTPNNNDLLVTVDVGAGTTKNISREQFFTGAPLPADTVDEQAIELSTLKFGNYSTAEVDTGFTWVDGSPIYKKTINTGTLPNSSTKSVPHGITGLTYVISMGGSAYSPSTNETFSIPHVSVGQMIDQVRVDVSGSNIRLFTGLNRTNFTKSYITLMYVK